MSEATAAAEEAAQVAAAEAKVLQARLDSSVKEFDSAKVPYYGISRTPRQLSAWQSVYTAGLVQPVSFAGISAFNCCHRLHMLLPKRQRAELHVCGLINQKRHSIMFCGQEASALETTELKAAHDAEVKRVEESGRQNAARSVEEACSQLQAHLGTQLDASAQQLAALEQQSVGLQADLAVRLLLDLHILLPQSTLAQAAL